MASPYPFNEYEIAYTLEDVHFEMHSEDLKDDLGVLELDYLECAERRVLMWESDGTGPTLEYGYYLQTPDFVEPPGGISAPKITLYVIGRHPNGCQIQLNGLAYVYVDEATESADVLYPEPPMIMVLSGIPDDEPEQVEEDAAPDGENVVLFRKQQVPEQAG